MLLTEYFQWSKDSAVFIEAKIFGVKIAAVVNTGCSGVAISQGCFECLNLQEDEVVDFLLTLATGTFRKPIKYFKKLSITVGKSVTFLPVIVLEGLHY